MNDIIIKIDVKFLYFFFFIKLEKLKNNSDINLNNKEDN